jgi:uncharacterized protein (TIGR02145 family)
MKKIVVSLFLCIHFAAYAQVVGTPYIIGSFSDPSSNGTAVVSAYTCSTASAGTMTSGIVVSGVTQTITATVTTVGTYAISTTANGVTFAASGTFAGTGSQNIVLTATGTPTAAGTNSFTLDTTPNCSFSRTTVAPLPANITLSSITPYFVLSVNDQDYRPYTSPTVAASLATAQAANGVNESTALDIQGSLTTTGETIKIPYTVVTASVSLPAFSQTINIPASFTEDNIARDVTFSYPDATLAVGSGTIIATLQAVGGTLNAKKLDLQSGIGNDGLGWLLAQFTCSTNSSGGTAIFQVRNIAAIPDRNYADAAHRMLYYPVLGAGGKTWLNNNLGADYANTTKASFNPVAQATSSRDISAYGSLFQWGRFADGHELINWVNFANGTAVVIGTTTTRPNNDVPVSNKFIYVTSGTNPRDWRSTRNVNLWQGVFGTNNPCPIGYRLPTESELNFERLSWAPNNNGAGALASPLKLSTSGSRVSTSTGTFDRVGTAGYQWTSTVSSNDSRNLYFDNGVSPSAPVAGWSTGYRAFAASVRCIKD